MSILGAMIVPHPTLIISTVGYGQERKVRASALCPEVKDIIIINSVTRTSSKPHSAD